MAVIDICSTEGITVDSGSIGFGYNPEMSLTIQTALFDSAVAVDDLVLYRINTSQIVYKGIVRRVQRTLSGERVKVSVSAVETILQSREWEPVLSAYNKEIICPDRLMNATFQQLVDKEFVGLPASWFTSIVVPPSVGALTIAPIETSQIAFIDLLEQALSIYEHVQWYIDYSTGSATAALPIGRLVFVDTNLGATPVTLTVGGATGTVIDADVAEDYSRCAASLNIYSGDYVEVDEVLEPAWKIEDETLQKLLVLPTPTQAMLDAPEVPVTYIPWGYDIIGVVSAYLKIGETSTKLFYGTDYWMDLSKGALFWNRYNGRVNSLTGQISTQGDRAMAAYMDGFTAETTTLELTIVYSGPDCYRLYHVTEPIADKRIRLGKQEDPENLGDIIDLPVEQDTVIEAFMPAPSYADADYERWYETRGDQQLEHLAKLRVMTDFNIYWDERNPDYGSTKGFGIPLGSPTFETGRRCVRFDKQNLMQIIPVWTEITADTPLDEPGRSIQFYTWPIKCRYTAWRKLHEVRTGSAGTEYEGRFIFDEQYKYTKFDGTVLVDRSAKLQELADQTQEFYGEPTWEGSVSIVAPLTISGLYKTATLAVPLGARISFAGAVGPALSSFFGIVNQLDLTALESGTAALGVGPRAPSRNPFVEKPPTYVDREAITRIVYDRSVFDRRST